MQDIDVPVLIVGAGPVGLLGGILLAQHGIPSRVVERRSEPQRAPAAHVVNARTLEILRGAGVDMQAVAELCQDPADAGFARFVTTLVGEELGCLPFERQGDDCLAFTPTPLRNLSQHHLEPLLADALRKSGGAALEYGQEWEEATQDADGVTSLVRDRATGRATRVRSRWLLAADGAGSRVRKSLGIRLEGPARIRSFVMIHFGANLRPLVKDRPGVLFWICDPEAGGTLVAHDVEREWVYMHAYDPDTESAADYDPARCRALVRRALGTDDVEVEVRAADTWTMTAQVADAMRDRRIFLVGDAAHRFPPTGGLGLNSGAQDVHNLAWKLRAVEDGRASDALLDSYERERRPVARRNADQSLRNALRLVEVFQALGTTEEPTTARMQATLDDPAGRARVEAAVRNQAEHFDMLGLQLGFAYEDGALVPDGTPKPEGANPVRDYVPTSRPGSRLPHAWVVRDGERISTLDLVEPGAFTLLTGPDGEAWARAAASQSAAPVRCVAIGSQVADPDGHWASVREVGADGALLVRPDQHVAWRVRALPPEPDRALAQALARVLDPPAGAGAAS